ncbi:MAG: DUF4494 domain-containing protein [Bacteroidales bacterium]|jgi:hypothetical protein|nr:DUF4494 domain-containing protein [Bacteroidales bacterium]
MNVWFEIKVSYDKVGNKEIAKTTETYLINAVNFTEAETRITMELEPFQSGEFEVLGIKKIKINELVRNEYGDRWYRAKIMFITYDEKSDTEKLLPYTYLIQSKSLQSAVEEAVESIAKTMGDYTIVSIVETMIMDVFDYKSVTVLKQKIIEN